MGDLATGGSYSPDGKRIAFAASSNGNSDVFVCNADGSDPRRLTDDPATDGSPTWSPDGRRIAFVSNRSGHPQPHYSFLARGHAGAAVHHPVVRAVVTPQVLAAVLVHEVQVPEDAVQEERDGPEQQHEGRQGKPRLLSAVESVGTSCRAVR